MREHFVILLIALIFLAISCSGDRVRAKDSTGGIPPISFESPDPIPRTPKSYVVDPVDAMNYKLDKIENELSNSLKEDFEELRAIIIANFPSEEARMKHTTLDRFKIHFGETGKPGWIPEDVNKDGIIDVLDMIPIAVTNIK